MMPTISESTKRLFQSLGLVSCLNYCFLIGSCGILSTFAPIKDSLNLISTRGIISKKLSRKVDEHYTYVEIHIILYNVHFRSFVLCFVSQYTYIRHLKKSKSHKICLSAQIIILDFHLKSKRIPREMADEIYFVKRW